MLKDREARSAAAHGVQRVGHDRATEQQQQNWGKENCRTLIIGCLKKKIYQSPLIIQEIIEWGKKSRIQVIIHLNVFIHVSK